MINQNRPGLESPGFFYACKRRAAGNINQINSSACAWAGFKINFMENLKEIVKGTTARLSFVCDGKVCYQIETPGHLYQLEIDSCGKDWAKTYLFPEFKAISLMRWIRKGIDSGDGSFIQLK